MTTQNYLIIQENVVTNVVIWDGDITSWAPPADAVVFGQEEVVKNTWVWNSASQDWELTGTVTAVAHIGDLWDGTSFSEPKPTDPPQVEATQAQPISNGTQTL